jgi:hypothetical protein
MVQIDLKEQLNNTHEKVQNSNDIKHGRISIPSEPTGTGTSGFNSAKSSVREILQNQKSATRRKSKSQNRARKALRTITFILGTFRILSQKKLFLHLSFTRVSMSHYKSN